MNRYEIYQVSDENEELWREYAFSSLDEIRRRRPECFGYAEAEDAERIATAACALPRNDRMDGDAGLPRLPREAWELVYTYATEKEPSLDWIFGTFNRGRPYRNISGLGEPPADFEGHSMSVSDIVQTPDGRLWFCDSIGWREVTWQT